MTASLSNSAPRRTAPQGSPGLTNQRPVPLADTSAGAIQFHRDTSSRSGENAGSELLPASGTHSRSRAAPLRASDAGAGNKPPALPAPVAIVIRTYERRIINRNSIATNPIFENKGWHTVSLPYVSILGDEAITGEVLL